jgi:hypothetical protein
VTHSNDEKLVGAFLFMLVDDFPVLAQSRRRVRNEIQLGRPNDLIAKNKRMGQKKKENEDGEK